jgi:hypothetical protein
MDRDQAVADNWDKARTAPQYDPLTRLRFRVPGMIDRPADVCPLPVPVYTKALPVLILPEDDQRAIRLALKRVLSTHDAWRHDMRVEVGGGGG